MQIRVLTCLVAQGPTWPTVTHSELFEITLAYPGQPYPFRLYMESGIVFTGLLPRDSIKNEPDPCMISSAPQEFRAVDDEALEVFASVDWARMHLSNLRQGCRKETRGFWQRQYVQHRDTLNRLIRTAGGTTK